jgi:hypothetical protein
MTCNGYNYHHFRPEMPTCDCGMRTPTIAEANFAERQAADEAKARDARIIRHLENCDRLNHGFPPLPEVREC